MPIETKVFTGGQSSLDESLKVSFSTAERIDIITSFTKVTGVEEIRTELSDASERGVKIRFLTGTYLGITEPNAIRMLKDICGDNIDIRFYRGTNSFHPKAYFIYGKNSDCMYIGSSNLSRSALTDGVEWNYRLTKNDNFDDFCKFSDEFERLFTSDESSYEATDAVIEDYRSNWHPPEFRIPSVPKNGIRKNEVQIEALYNLDRTRGDGMSKALVVAATGTGKTILAAFDSLNFKKILFIAHTEDILRQAESSFKGIRPDDSSGHCYGGEFDIEKDMTFASIQTLSRDDNLNKIPADHFDYIVVDEFHHAAADTYRKVMDHLHPKFMLGLSATPERMDNKDIYVLCDYNVVYEIGLKEAIDRHYLSRFAYFGIYDDTVDYDKIKYVNGSYDDDQLNEQMINERRASLILKNYKRFGSERALGFCSSIEHAEFMASYFIRNGVRSAVVASRPNVSNSIDRKDAVDRLSSKDISVVFSVDMFNEGVDVPSIDMVMFLRPTESETVFIQQLGRGLRLYEDKDHLTVLDFIGNYRKAELIPSFIVGKRGMKAGGDLSKGLPAGCIADFDLELIELFSKMEKRGLKIKDMRDAEYRRVKEELGHVPSRCELFTDMDPEVWKIIRNKKENNPFRDYLTFLNEMGDLDTIRRSFIDNEAHGFLNMIETTAMSRMYKMPLLLSFIDGNELVLEPDGDRIIRSFKEFYSRDNNIIDFSNIRSKADRTFSDREWLKMAKENPIHFLCKSESIYFSECNGLIRLTDEMRRFSGVKVFIDEMKDIIELRTMDFKQSRYYEK